jgi:formamidopyrimidine-DNA glycosylase
MQTTMGNIYDFTNKTMEDLKGKPLTFRLTPNAKKCEECGTVIVNQKRIDFRWVHWCLTCEKEVV